MDNMNVWELLYKINLTGKNNLLTISITTMLRNGIIKITTNGENNIGKDDNQANNLTTILKAVKKACCVELDSHSNNLNMLECTNTIINLIGCNGLQIISRGAWVLLSAIISQENNVLSGLTGGNITSMEAVTRFLSEDNSDNGMNGKDDLVDRKQASFVVNCFLLKQQQKFTNSNDTASLQMGNETGILNNVDIVNVVNDDNDDDDGAANLDEDDIRMLQVIEKLANTISIDEINVIKKILLRKLHTFLCTPSAITATISVLFAFSKSIAKTLVKNEDINGEFFGREKGKDYKILGTEYIKSLQLV